jgi:hypothetical protein
MIAHPSVPQNQKKKVHLSTRVKNEQKNIK